MWTQEEENKVREAVGLPMWKVGDERFYFPEDEDGDEKVAMDDELNVGRAWRVYLKIKRPSPAA